MNYKIYLVKEFLKHDKEIIIELHKPMKKNEFHHFYPTDDDGLLHSITIWYQDKDDL